MSISEIFWWYIASVVVAILVIKFIVPSHVRHREDYGLLSVILWPIILIIALIQELNNWIND